MAGHPTIPIVIDTREQSPLSFANLDCTVETGTVKIFDYALRGDVHPDGNPRWAIERKSLPDFVGSITGRVKNDDGTPGPQAREFAKIRKARKVFDAGTSIIYVVETTIRGVLPERACPCIHQRASTRCKKCGGKAEAFCDCIHARPQIRCEFCGGSGVLGYDYKRRKIGAPFAYHQIAMMMYQYNVAVLFADSRLIAACMIESLLRQRWMILQIIKHAADGNMEAGEQLEGYDG